MRCVAMVCAAAARSAVALKRPLVPSSLSSANRSCQLRRHVSTRSPSEGSQHPVSRSDDPGHHAPAQGAGRARDPKERNLEPDTAQVPPEARQPANGGASAPPAPAPPAQASAQATPPSPDAALMKELFGRVDQMASRLDTLEKLYADALNNQPAQPASVSVQSAAQVVIDPGAGEGDKQAKVASAVASTGEPGSEKAQETLLAAASSIAQEAGEKIADAATSFDLKRLNKNIQDMLNSTHVESIRDLRNALMVYEWEMGAKGHAARSGVAQFENWCALNAAEEVDYIQIQKLYDNPFDVSPLPSTKLRLLAHSLIEQSMREQYTSVYKEATTMAKEISEKHGVSQMLQPASAATTVIKKVLPWPLSIIFK